jgi:hypothetical protein
MARAELARRAKSEVNASGAARPAFAASSATRSSEKANRGVRSGPASAAFP